MIPHVTETSWLGIRWLCALEGLRLEAYLDSRRIATIGYGTTLYPNGRRVQLGDKIDQSAAQAYFRNDLKTREKAVDSFTRDDLLQHEFDALVSFCYNAGREAYRTSTLARLVNEKASPDAIRAQLMRWVYGDTDPSHPGLEVDPGLVNRRRCDANVYCDAKYTTQDGRIVT